MRPWYCYQPHTYWYIQQQDFVQLMEHRAHRPTWDGKGKARTGRAPVLIFISGVLNPAEKMQLLLLLLLPKACHSARMFLTKLQKLPSQPHRSGARPCTSHKGLIEHVISTYPGPKVLDKRGFHEHTYLKSKQNALSPCARGIYKQQKDASPWSVNAFVNFNCSGLDLVGCAL